MTIANPYAERKKGTSKPIAAIALLKAHNVWRRDGEGEMHDPTELGLAIDAVVGWCERMLPVPQRDGP